MSAQVPLVGRLAADPELRYGSNGTPVAKFTVVTSRRVKDKQSGEWTDADTSYWDCVAFNQTAESVCESLQRGMAVIVVGKMAQRTFETRDGEKRKTFEVTVDNVGPDLRSATAKVAKAQRQQGGGGNAPGATPWDGAPAGGGGFGQDAPRSGGRSDTYGGQGRGGQQSAPPAGDPWATGTAGPNDSEPPF